MVRGVARHAVSVRNLHINITGCLLLGLTGTLAAQKLITLTGRSSGIW